LGKPGFAHSPNVRACCEGGPTMRLRARFSIVVLLRGLPVVVLVLGMRGVGLAQCDAFKRVFVTSTTYDGNLGGLAGADAKCAARAAAAGLSGTYKAWLSSSTTSAASRLTHATVPYKRTDGVTVANNWTDLTDGALAVQISHDEFGHEVDAAGFVWTGTANDGSNLGGPPCCDWTCNLSEGVIGITSPVSGPTSIWTWFCFGYDGCPWPAFQSCDQPLVLYCFQQ